MLLVWSMQYGERLIDLEAMKRFDKVLSKLEEYLSQI